MMPSPRNDAEFIVPVIQPYDPHWMFDFLARRALPGIERVDGLRYSRRLAGSKRWLTVTWQNSGLAVRVPALAALDHSQAVGIVRRLFDADCDPAGYTGVLASDPLLRDGVHSAPGLRVPGAWDGFETAVRAILGQQVSVARATRLAGRMIERYGAGEFPGPEALLHATPAELGMPGQRGQAITGLARAVEMGEVSFAGVMNGDELARELLAIPGIGPWTASYISMRVARDPDAFLAADWVVRKQLAATPAAARRIADAWRPWRAYAVMYLWRAAGRRATSS